MQMWQQDSAFFVRSYTRTGTQPGTGVVLSQVTSGLSTVDSTCEEAAGQEEAPRAQQLGNGMQWVCYTNSEQVGS